MKLILTATLLAGLATSAIADNSDRYNDLRFDSAVGHVSDIKTDTQDDAARNTEDARKDAVTFSARNNAKTPTSYAYANPYGVGPDNDSR